MRHSLKGGAKEESLIQEKLPAINLFKEGICNTFLSLGLQFLLSERDVVSFKYIGIATRKFSLLGQRINSLHFKSLQRVPPQKSIGYQNGEQYENEHSNPTHMMLSITIILSLMRLELHKKYFLLMNINRLQQKFGNLIRKLQIKNVWFQKSLNFKWE